MTHCWQLVGILLVATAGITLPTNAQIVSDGTLSTTVTQSGNDFTITNGNQVGSNLFHSFSQFSIPTGGSAFFNNATNVQNIFARVTGGSVSQIDGLIRANGSANLFLLNPAGILFGPNASLNLGGSFIASTAESVVFADNVKFSATDTASPPLLTVSLPVGLQMGSNPAPITMQGSGHSVTAIASLAPLTLNPSTSELRVQAGKTLALVGGNLTLTGATLNAPQGRVELGSLGGAGLVSLNPVPQGYQLAYASGQSFRDIQFTQKSLVYVGALPSAGAFNAGATQIQGRNIQFSDGSLVLSKNLGSLPGGEIFVQASESLRIIGITGTTADDVIRSGLRTEALNTGRGSSIRVITPNLQLLQGSGINALAFASAASGHIQINAGTLEVSGFAPLNPTGVTSLTTSTRSLQPAGNLSIISNNLLVADGAGVSSISFGAGSTGQVNVRSTNVTITGSNPAGLNSNISATSFGTGNAQTLTLDTANLQVLNGGLVATTSWLTGNAGNVNVNATNSILVSGRSQTGSSSINSAVLRPEPLIRLAFGLPDILTGNAGNVNVTTPHLTLTDGGNVSVTNQGTGNGGSIKIAAKTILLNRQGNIQAQTASGEGGNISLQVGETLILRRGGFINATAGGTGNGGNITIQAPFIVAVRRENSDIIANAFRGRGGNIQITTQGIFGLKFRDQLTPESDITASSQFGISGNVQISTISIDPTTGLVDLPVEIVDPSQQIATGCVSHGDSRFVAIGRGGVPQNPTQQVINDRTWEDMRDLAVYRHNHPVAQTPPSPTVVVEATHWQRDSDGTMALIADQNPATLPAFANCSGAIATTADSR